MYYLNKTKGRVTPKENARCRDMVKLESGEAGRIMNIFSLVFVALIYTN